MKVVSDIFRRNFLTILLFFSLPIIICSCSVVGRTESPFAAGVGVHITPGVQIGDSRFSVHALAGYEKVWVKGNANPRQNFLLLGGQGRYSLSDDPDGNGLWAGGEFAYLNVKYKDDNYSRTSSGFEAAALGGYRLKVATIPVSVYVAPGFFRAKYGAGGGSFGGFHGRVGFDIHFMSLLTSKGR